MRFMKRTLAAALLLGALGFTGLQAQSDGNWNFPTQFGPANSGTDFFFSCPSNWDLPGSNTYYIRLYITSTTKTNVEVWVGGVLKQTLVTKPYAVVTADLTASEAQAIVRTDAPPVPNDALYRNKAIRVVAEDPVILYVMNRTTYTSDGMLLLPVSALGREYIASSYSAVIGGTQELPSQFLVIAPYDSTQVTITPPMASPNHPGGTPYTVTLDQGDVYSVMSVGAGGDMSGAVITGDKPIAVVAGQNCTYIPDMLNFCCCDHLAEGMLPVASWGTTYYAVPLATRLKGDFYRVFAKEANTTVSIDGVVHSTINGPGGVAGTGWFEYRAMTKDPVEFTADKPISVFQYSTSGAYDGNAGDPFYLTLTPLEQYGTQMVFSTPGNDFPINYVNIVTDSANLHALEIAVGETNSWQNVLLMPGAGTPVGFTTQHNGKDYVGLSLSIPGGVYKLRAPEPFAVYSYGFSDWDSYGYPAGALTCDLTIDDTTAPMITAVRDYGGNTSGVISAEAADGARRTTLSTISLPKELAENFQFTLSEFKPGLTTDAEYSLSPVDRKKFATATLYVSDMVGNTRTVTVTYEPVTQVEIDISGAPITFEDGLVGARFQEGTVVTNNGKEMVEIHSISLADGNKGFKVLGPSAPFTLAPAGSAGNSMTVDVEFQPIGAGTFSDTVLFWSKCCVLFKVPVIGFADDHVVSVPLDGQGATVSSVNVSPNPARGEMAVVNFTMQRKGSLSVMIVDAAGKDVQAIADGVVLEQGAQSLKLDLGGLASGSYFVRIVAAGRTVIAPLVITR